MLRSCLGATVLVFPVLLVGCIGIEHEDIGGSGDGGTHGSTHTSSGGDGDGDGDGDGEGTGDTGAKFDIGAGDGDGDGDLGELPRLFVSGADGVAMWTVDGIVDDAPADGALALGNSEALALALALGDDTLFVASTDPNTPLHLYPGPASLADMEAPAGGVGVMTGFDDAALTSVAQMHVDADDNLWMVDEGVRLFEAASALGMDSSPSAQFIGNSPGVASAAHDGSGTKLLGAHTSEGVLFWDAPLAASGQTVPTGALAGAFEARRVLIVGDDLFAASGADAFLRVWHDVAGIMMPTAPDVTLGDMVTGLASPVHLFARGTTLVVTDDSAGGRVLIWDDASSIVADQPADHTIGEGELSGPTQAILSADGLLLVRDGGGFRVYADALGSATLQATVDAKLGDTTDMVLLECRDDGDCQGSCVNGTCM